MTSTKFRFLANLLPKLKAAGSRPLIFRQGRTRRLQPAPAAARPDPPATPRPPLIACLPPCLLCSQWTAVLDIMEWLMEVLQLPYVRLDGSTGARRRGVRGAEPPTVRRWVATKSAGLALTHTHKHAHTRTHAPPLLPRPPQPWTSAWPQWIASIPPPPRMCLPSCCPRARGGRASTSPARTRSSCTVRAAPRAPARAAPRPRPRPGWQTPLVPATRSPLHPPTHSHTHTHAHTLSQTSTLTLRSIARPRIGATAWVRPSR